MVYKIKWVVIWTFFFVPVIAILFSDEAIWLEVRQIIGILLLTLLLMMGTIEPKDEEE